ncbi:hypothetical protein Pla52o_34650 [Novipirellula galeiformis]|uniref:Uncharacterized protein n=1 Tax=Novipirellula galeiformis TaxID=2528004 RepID=A0A5C6CI34_9BACT|nr:hypothetical protein [Novipirellula galeiformis]TWU22409.1 hypothetical protein Pla52o_34650 [Novipirellula galeiformis]
MKSESPSPSGSRPSSSNASSSSAPTPPPPTTRAGRPIGNPASQDLGKRNPAAATVLLAAVIAGLVGIATYSAINVSKPEPVIENEFEIIVPKVIEPSRDVLRAAFFDREVEPEIEVTDRLNREAAERCIERVQRLVRRYHRGVAPFVNDLTSISTRLGIVKRMPASWWNEDNRIEDYVAKKFETHLFSEQVLASDIAGILEDFRKEIDANQKRMLVNVHASLEIADLPEVQLDSYEPFYELVSQRLQSFSADQGATSVYNAIVVILISEAGSYAATTVAAGLLARFSATAAVGAAAGAGTAAGAAATGAGGGSLVGPVGTVVGLGVGLAVGLIIDWWMTENFELKVSEQLHDYLEQLERTLLEGAPRDPPTIDAAQLTRVLGSQHHATGLKSTLPIVCDQLADAYRDQFFAKIVSPGKSHDEAY